MSPEKSPTIHLIGLSKTLKAAERKAESSLDVFKQITSAGLSACITKYKKERGEYPSRYKSFCETVNLGRRCPGDHKLRQTARETINLGKLPGIS